MLFSCSLSLIKMHDCCPVSHAGELFSFLTFCNWSLLHIPSEHSIKLIEGNDDEDKTHSVIVISPNHLRPGISDCFLLEVVAMELKG